MVSNTLCPAVLGKLCIQAFCPLPPSNHFQKGAGGLRAGLEAWCKRGWGPGKGSEGLGALRGWGPDALGGLRPGGSWNPLW